MLLIVLVLPLNSFSFLTNDTLKRDLWPIQNVVDKSMFLHP